jgi:hypothetical protein
MPPTVADTEDVTQNALDVAVRGSAPALKSNANVVTFWYVPEIEVVPVPQFVPVPYTKVTFVATVLDKLRWHTLITCVDVSPTISNVPDAAEKVITAEFGQLYCLSQVAPLNMKG